MSVNTHQMMLALRTKALTLSVATTGSISIEVTATGFVRATGSFLTDGFHTGMEFTAAGTTSNDGTHVATQVTALEVSASGLTVEADGAGKTLTVELPSNRAWENIDFDPTAGEPWVEEQFLGGPSSQITTGPNGWLEVDPLYVLQVHAVEGKGVGAPNGYADALLSLFSPLTAMTLTNGDVLRVRTDTGPYRGQLLRRRPGYATVPVTVPLRLQTLNN